MSGRIEARLAELGIELPAAPAPVANFAPCVQSGALLFVSGHPAVMNGASDVLVEVFGEAGRHARFAVGVSSLPAGAAVEAAAVLEISA